MTEIVSCAKFCATKILSRIRHFGILLFCFALCWCHLRNRDFSLLFHVCDVCGGVFFAKWENFTNFFSGQVKILNFFLPQIVCPIRPPVDSIVRAHGVQAPFPGLDFAVLTGHCSQPPPCTP